MFYLGGYLTIGHHAVRAVYVMSRSEVDSKTQWVAGGIGGPYRKLEVIRSACAPAQHRPP